jgi:DNA-binding CsgD family transcriptional regulator
LEEIDRAIVLATADGRIQWLSALAREWLFEIFPDFARSATCLPLAIKSQMSSQIENQPEGRRWLFELRLPASRDQYLSARFVGTSDGMFVIVLERERSAIGPALSDSLGLTQREGEILYWISEAKADREIAVILGISHRTVHKHVEHLFAKLGVDNRAAALRLGRDVRRV